MYDLLIFELIPEVTISETPANLFFNEISCPVPNVLYISLYSMFRGLGFSTLYVYSALYVIEVLKGTYLYDGILFAVAGTISAVIQIFGGSLSDRIGYSLSIWISLVVFISIFALLSFDSTLSGSIPYFSISFISLLAANSLQAPASNALLSSSTDAKLRGFSILRIANNLGWGIGPALGGFLISLYGYPSLFRFAFVMGLLALIVALFLRDTAKVPSGRRSFSTDNGFLIFLSLASLLVFIVQSQETITLSNYVKIIRNLPYYDLGIVYMTNGIFVIISQGPVYRIIKRIGNYFSFGVGSIIYSLGFFSFAFDHSLLSMIISTLILTIGEDLAFPTGLTIVSEISRPERIGRNMGIYNAFLQFGRALGPIISGLVFTVTLNPYAIWGLTSVWGILGSAIFLMIFREGIHSPFSGGASDT